MRLVHQRDPCAPCALFITPIRKLGGDGERDWWPVLITQEIHHVVSLIKCLGKCLMSNHLYRLSLSQGVQLPKPEYDARHTQKSGISSLWKSRLRVPRCALATLRGTEEETYKNPIVANSNHLRQNVVSMT